MFIKPLLTAWLLALASPSPSQAQGPLSTLTTQSTQSSGAPTSYKGIALYHHNIHRQNHSVPNLVWSDAVAATAKKIASSCVYEHNTTVDGGGYGQNIAAGVPANNISLVITELFYNNEEPRYKKNTRNWTRAPNMTQFGNWGHFTQVVWKGTSSVGCATQYCPKGLKNTGGGIAPYFTVCNYKGPGNYLGEFRKNVPKPLGRPTAHWNTGL